MKHQRRVTIFLKDYAEKKQDRDLAAAQREIKKAMGLDSTTP